MLFDHRNHLRDKWRLPISPPSPKSTEEIWNTVLEAGTPHSYLPLKVKQIPIRVPISESSAAKDPYIAVLDPASGQQTNQPTAGSWGCRNSHAPEKKPYVIAKTIVPGTSRTANVQKMRIPQAELHMIVRLMIPIRGTRIGGITRPKMLAPFNIVNWQKGRYDFVGHQNWEAYCIKCKIWRQAILDRI